MGSKKEVGRTRRAWQTKVGRALSATDTLREYKTSLDRRNLEEIPSEKTYMYMAALAGLQNWEKAGKATYLTDDTLIEELLETPLPDGETPHSVFHHRPHIIPYCVFATPILRPLVIDGEQKLVAFEGFIAYNGITIDCRDENVLSIRILFIGRLVESGYTVSVTFVIPLGEFYAVGEPIVQLSTPTTVNLNLLHEYDAKQYEESKGVYEETYSDPRSWPVFSDLFHLATNIMLYVSADNIDLDEVVKPAVAGRPVIPSSAPSVHRLGFRMGAALRAARNASSESAHKTGRAVATHLRRAHWHRYWTGPRSGDRKLVVRWLHQTLVNPGDDYVPAVRPVKKTA